MPKRPHSPASVSTSPQLPENPPITDTILLRGILEQLTAIHAILTRTAPHCQKCLGTGHVDGNRGYPKCAYCMGDGLARR